MKRQMEIAFLVVGEADQAEYGHLGEQYLKNKNLLKIESTKLSLSSYILNSDFNIKSDFSCR